jgi:hypothetical protein
LLIAGRQSAIFKGGIMPRENVVYTTGDVLYVPMCLKLQIIRMIPEKQKEGPLRAPPD